MIRWGKRKEASRFRVLIASACAVVVDVMSGMVTRLALLSLLDFSWHGREKE